MFNKCIFTISNLIHLFDERNYAPVFPFNWRILSFNSDVKPHYGETCRNMQKDRAVKESDSKRERERQIQRQGGSDSIECELRQMFLANKCVLCTLKVNELITCLERLFLAASE